MQKLLLLVLFVPVLFLGKEKDPEMDLYERYSKYSRSFFERSAKIDARGEADIRSAMLATMAVTGMNAASRDDVLIAKLSSVVREEYKGAAAWELAGRISKEIAVCEGFIGTVGPGDVKVAIEEHHAKFSGFRVEFLNLARGYSDLELKMKVWPD